MCINACFANFCCLSSNVKVLPENVLEGQVKRNQDGLETSSLKLRLLLRSDHFKNGLLKVKCVASVLDVYQMSHETSVDVYEKNFKPEETTHEETGESSSDPKSGPNNKRKKKNRNKQDNSKNTVTSGIPENMSQGKLFHCFHA